MVFNWGLLQVGQSVEYDFDLIVCQRQRSSIDLVDQSDRGSGSDSGSGA